jgi:hypothetical protein
MKKVTDNVETVEATDQPKTIQDYSTTELKALVYDSLVTIEANQANIKFINEELKKRS